MENFQSEKQIQNSKDELTKQLKNINKELLEALQNIIKEYDLDIVKGIDARKIRELIKKATTI